jgi:phenylacetate-CoA ligase
MALQCPEREHFHVQSEVTMVEVLDEDGRQCEPGRIGKVVVTPLHNFATPLLRYEIGDEAEVGAPCSCGRGLPVLSRIVGRSYDYLVLSGGRRRRVDTGYYRICKVRAVCEFQLVQLELDLVELRMVLTRPLTSEETADIEGVLREEFGAEFRLRFTVCESLPRTAAGKLRSFVSELDG